MAINVDTLSPGRLGHPAQSRRSLSQSIVAGLTALLDVAAVSVPGFVIYLAYIAPGQPEKLTLYATVITVYAVVLVQTFHLTGLYRFGRIIRPHAHIPKFLAIVAFVFLALLACAFALKISDLLSRVWSFSWLITMTLGIVSGRLAVAGLVRRWAAQGRIGRNIVVFGAGTQGERLIEHIESVDEPWNRIVGVFDDRGDRINPACHGYRVSGDLEELVAWARDNRADEILIALPWGAADRIMGIVRTLSALPANIRLSPEFVGTDLLHRRTSYHYRVPMLNVLEKPVSGWGAFTKSLVDFGLGSLFLVLSLPLLALIALCIKLESKGPILFKQQRYGFNNKLIDVYKFRTMYVDRLDNDAERLTERNDPRVTRVGAILRRLSLDELPQLFNVLRGEMSVVGPRPHALRAKAGGRLYEDVVDEYAVRHKVKPGITGWAQVNGWRGNTHTEADLLGRIEHDLYYIENWSLMFDLSIILRTFWAVLGGRNSY